MRRQIRKDMKASPHAYWQAKCLKSPPICDNLRCAVTPIAHSLPKNRLMPLRWLLGAWPALPMLIPSQAFASIFQGEALDTVADVISWVVLVVAPLIGLTVFWLVHILPEKIAHKKQHPQTKAIQVLWAPLITAFETDCLIFGKLEPSNPHF